MPLQNIAPSGTAAGTSLLDRIDLDLMSAIQMAVLAVVTLILGLFVVRPVLSRAPDQASGEVPALPASPSNLPTQVDTMEGLSGEIATEGFDLPDLTEFAGADGTGGDLPALAGLPMMGGGDEPVDRLRAMIGERKEETVEILRSWLEDKEENA